MKAIILKISILYIFGISFCLGQNSFEGIITYKTEITFKTENVRHKAYFSQKFGDSLKIFYNKKGDIHKKYYGTGDSGYDFHTYLSDNNNYYGKWKNLDTIYYYNTKENTLKFIEKKSGNSTKILGKPSKYIKIKGIFPIDNQIVTQKFYYTGFPIIDPELYENFQDFFTYEFLKTTKSPFLKMELDLGDYVVTYTVIQIQNKQLNPKIFKLPKNTPLKLY